MGWGAGCAPVQILGFERGAAIIGAGCFRLANLMSRAISVEKLTLRDLREEFHDQMWVLVVESKRQALSLSVGIPQVLTYMVSKGIRFMRCLMSYC